MTEKKSKAEKKVKKESKDDKIAELTETLQRLQADFENYKKQCDKSAQQHQMMFVADMMSKLLPNIDHFQLALEQKSNSEEFHKGIEMIYAELFGLMDGYGLRPIEAVGKDFDPYYHEVMLQEESDKPGKVLDEIQKGYMLGDKVLRLSKVKVGKEKKKK